MANSAIYEDLVETATAQYSKEGWTAVRSFLFDGTPSNDPTGTLYACLTDPAIPPRGEPHPSIPGICADVIDGEAESPTQVKIKVSYKTLSAVTQEPDDSVPGLLTVGSSVQEQEVAVDADGVPLVAKYTSSNNYTVQDSDGNPISSPSVVGTAKKQTPNMVFKFARREQYPADDKAAQFTGMVNKNAMTIGITNIPAGCLLCTRIDSNTQDDGNSYVVDYEFQYAPQVTLPDGVHPGWEVGVAYTIPTGCTLVDSNGNTIASAGDIPTDATNAYYLVYGEEDFTKLNLVAV